ncbi:DUF3823 domain-containing protein [Paraflavitalea sp. CAU 1676]|uniref:DUF3823 domain-containing protein n=1 Tax=Paraflavitalea sp. CAU 1676 TaxID=3032598 RepID=UPI0023DAFA45|nr:DUF3823 domain-containing protein [Paraflavitalea sp. CAU 1676]MDF2187851.1 DUF3823 domain-containing protein [Paraflavitalea sp. CAU 1676]
MKKTTYIILGMTMLMFSSCYKKDNWSEPDARVYGNIIDSYTKKPLLTSQNDWSIRIWERSWKESTPINQNIPVKQDGSYNNNKLFAGSYDMLPVGGAFWPFVDTAKGVTYTKGGAQQDFTVTPYLQVVDLTATVTGTNLTLTCRIKAPKRTGLPNLVEVKPFISLTSFVGESNYINIAEYNDKRIQINKSWVDENGDVETSKLYTIGPLPVKSGYTYNVRVGANVNDTYKKYNYSEIKQVIVP